MNDEFGSQSRSVARSGALREPALVEPKVEHAARWLRRHALFDSYADLVARGLCTLPEAVDSYLWELRMPKEDRMALLADMRSRHG